MSEYLVTDTQIASIADAIRTKGGTTDELVFPTGFVITDTADPETVKRFEESEVYELVGEVIK